MITKSAMPINDKEIVQFLSSLDFSQLLNHSPPSPAGEYSEDFIKEFKNWSDLNRKMPVFLDWPCLITSGTTESFLDFNLCHKKRETFVLKGEYPYHCSLGATAVDSYTKIPSNQKLIISYPFSASGNIYPDFEKVLNYCTQKNIIVLIDCALLFISNIEILDFAKYECVERIAFSLSKNFSSGRFRSGVSLIRNIDKKSHLALVNEWSYINHLSLSIHIELMKRFDCSYIFNKYRKDQLEICQNLNVRPSDTVIFGLSENEEHKSYSRSGFINRLCISDLLESSLK